MKKLFTLVVSLTAFTSLFAQTNAEREEAKRVILGERKGTSDYPTSKEDRDVVYRDNRTVYGDRDTRYPNRYPTESNTRERRIYEINRAYDAKIYSIRSNGRLSRNERERIIRQLEADRRRELAAVNNRYYGNNNTRNCDDDDYRGKNKKGNNGNHYGWQKGKGNPHKGNY